MAIKSTFLPDNRDKKILHQLQINSSQSNAELADSVGLSPSPCLRRVKRLEQEGFITGYSANVSREQLGYSIMAFIHITLSRQTEDDLAELERQLKDRPEVINCYLMTGSSDYLVQVIAKSLEDYTRFVRQHISRLPAVQNIQTSLALQTVIENKPLPVG